MNDATDTAQIYDDAYADAMVKTNAPPDDANKTYAAAKAKAKDAATTAADASSRPPPPLFTREPTLPIL